MRIAAVDSSAMNAPAPPAAALTAVSDRVNDLSHRLEIAAAAGVGIWSVHRESGHVEWNAQTAQIYGVPVEPSLSVPQFIDTLALRLPAAASAAGLAPALRSAPEPALAELGALGRRLPSAHILCIEDNPLNVMLVEALVAQRPALRLTCEPNGTLGVERAQQLRPDLVLVDMQLPDFDGVEVLRRLRAAPATAAVPCIALSANAMPDDIARALQAGFAAYWTKPLDVAIFLASLDAMFAPGEAGSAG
jgi:CheY-like chemotaxis protein